MINKFISFQLLASQKIHSVIVCLLLNFVITPSWADTLTLSIQPALIPNSTAATYSSLSKYLSKATGHTIKVSIAKNLQSHWASLSRKDDVDMVLEAAHFTDYRRKTMGYQVIAKVEGVISFSLITDQELMVFDAEELTGKKLVVVPSPSLAGAQLAHLFPNPMRQPSISSVKSFPEALTKLRTGKAVATIVPTALINGNNTVNTVSTTKAVPNSAFSLSRKVDRQTQQNIHAALIKANKSSKGKAMLKSIHVTRFEPASTRVYQGYARLLEGIWGY